LPKTARFFWQLTVDDPRIRPCVSLPPNDSYPSGHAIQAFVRAAVLAELFPESREALLERAHHSAWGRILGGVHYPTDDVGGRILAEALVMRLKTLPAFQQAVKACREEAREVRPAA